MCGGTDWQGEGTSTKVTFECSSHYYTSPYSREREREGERKTWQSMQETDERERVLEESLDGLSGQFRISKPP